MNGSVVRGVVERTVAEYGTHWAVVFGDGRRVALPSRMPVFSEGDE